MSTAPLYPHRAEAALRVLLGAWLADGTQLPATIKTWLRQALTDPAWRPTPREVARLRPWFLIWASTRGIGTEALQALGMQRFTTPLRDLGRRNP